MSQFQANLKKLPGISHLSALNLIDAEGNVVVSIENKVSRVRSAVGRVVSPFGATSGRDRHVPEMILISSHPET